MLAKSAKIKTGQAEQKSLLDALFVLRKAPTKHVEAWAECYEDRGSNPLASTSLDLIHNS